MHGGTMGQEIEVKFPLADREALIRRLQQSGGDRLYPETFEDNVILDRRGELKTKGALLRIRRFGKYTIATFKGPQTYADGAKVRDEVQTGMESFEVAIELFEALGFRTMFRYQKYREVWRLGKVEVVIDRTPIGNFFEIEGPLDMIRAVVADLGLDMNAAIKSTYVDLYRQQRRTRADLPEFMVFTDEEVQPA